jgi:selenide, water dikinase
MSEQIKLTQYSRGAGCGCKISPQVLQQILSNTASTITDKNLLVGNTHADDAAVYDLGNGTAVITTADFFMPIVDDAFQFGKIAAANSLSDVYAMGGKPLTAIALLGWPIDKLPAELAGEVMRGATEICNEAGIMISGGHTIDSAEPFFGLSVTGLVDIDKIRSNNLAQSGDKLYLTKPLGVGILSTAVKRGLASAEDEQIALKYMTQLNSIGATLAQCDAVSTMTDITGFGLAGHLIEICKASNVSAHLSYAAVPIIPEALVHQKNMVVPDATYRNWNGYSAHITITPEAPYLEAFITLPDPQTNGGLLICVNKDKDEAFKEFLAKHKIDTPFCIGELVPQEEKLVIVQA